MGLGLFVDCSGTAVARARDVTLRAVDQCEVSEGRHGDAACILCIDCFYPLLLLYIFFVDLAINTKYGRYHFTTLISDLEAWK